MTTGASCSRTHADVPPPSEPSPQTQPAAEGGEKTESVVLAAGCFWCVEAVFEPLEGVKDVVSGYAGGEKETAEYRKVASGQTKHAEVVRVTYDPGKIGLGELLRVFFATHDPTQVNRQGPDVGPQYRTAIFYADEAQRQFAADYIAELEKKEVFDKPIATTLEPLEAFYLAEDYHQDYVEHNPTQPYVVYHALPKVKKVREQFGDLLDGESGSSSANADEASTPR